jgi:hypothetical protein
MQFKREQRVFLARFTADAGIAVAIGERPQRSLHLHGRPAHLRFSTSWHPENGILRPGLLSVSATCAGNDLDDAARFLENRANATLYGVILALNAWCSPVREFAVVDASNGVEWRDARRSPRQREPELGRPMRRWREDVVAAFIFALWGSPFVQEIQYAVQHYAQALEHYRTGAAPMCLEHLFIAVEALKKVVLEQHRRKTGWSDNDYRKHWGANSRKHAEAIARLQIIFRGDEDTYQGTVDASNAMEHGDATYATLWELATRHQLKAAYHVRRAILNAVDLPPTMAARLLGRCYEEPLLDLAHHADQRLRIKANRAGLISGVEPQLFGVQRKVVGEAFDVARDTYDYTYAWEHSLDAFAEDYLCK